MSRDDDDETIVRFRSTLWSSCWISGAESKVPDGVCNSTTRIPQLISRESIQIRSQSSLDSVRFSIFERKVRMNQLAVRHRALLLFPFRLIIAHTNQCSRISMWCKTFEETDIERGLFDFMFQLHVRLVSRISRREFQYGARSRREFNNEPILNAFAVA